MLPGEIDVENYIIELENTIIKLTDENEALRGEIYSLKKKLLLYENLHTTIKVSDHAEDNISIWKEGVHPSDKKVQQGYWGTG